MCRSQKVLECFFAENKTFLKLDSKHFLLQVSFRSRFPCIPKRIGQNGSNNKMHYVDPIKLSSKIILFYATFV